jgi:hypothetical protein
VRKISNPLEQREYSKDRKKSKNNKKKSEISASPDCKNQSQPNIKIKLITEWNNTDDSHYNMK